MKWARDLLFIGLVVGGTSMLAFSLIPPRPTAVSAHDTRTYVEPTFRAAVEPVDAAFRKKWEEAKLRPAAPAAELQVARRLSLGLMGTVPSLEEIRHFEA